MIFPFFPALITVVFPIFSSMPSASCTCPHITKSGFVRSIAFLNEVLPVTNCDNDSMIVPAGCMCVINSVFSAWVFAFFINS